MFDRYLCCIGFGAAAGIVLALGGMYLALLYGPDNLVSI
jgi:hypothetical protein